MGLLPLHGPLSSVRERIVVLEAGDQPPSEKRASRSRETCIPVIIRANELILERT